MIWQIGCIIPGRQLDYLACSFAAVLTNCIVYLSFGGKDEQSSSPLSNVNIVLKSFLTETVRTATNVTDSLNLLFAF